MMMKQTPKISPRKPSQAAQAFVTAARATKESTSPTTSPKKGSSKASTSTGTSRRGNVRERGRTGEVVAQMTVYLPPDLEKQLRVEAVTRDVRPSDLIVEALRAYFGTK